MSLEKTNEAFESDCTGYAEVYPAEYTDTINAYYSPQVTEIENSGFSIHFYLPLYRKQLGMSVSNAAFCADSVFWLFFIRPLSGKIKMSDIALKDEQFSNAWFQRAPDETRRQRVMSRLGLIPYEILLELIAPGGEPLASNNGRAWAQFTAKVGHLVG